MVSARARSRWRQPDPRPRVRRAAIRAPRSASSSPARCRCARRGSARPSRSSSSWPARPRCRSAVPGAGADRGRPAGRSTPYGKRFTDFPHALLGIAQFVGAGRGLARGHRRRCRGPPVALGLAVGIWIGGFDLIYACQDVEVDRAHRRRVRSRPASASRPRCAPRRSCTWSRSARSSGSALAAGLGWLVVARRAADRRPCSSTSTASCDADDLSRVNRAFFTANGVVGIGLFVLRAGRPDRAGAALVGVRA